jgi:putative hydrolase of the HAD superfamily
VTRIRPSAVIFDYGNVLSAPQGAAEIQMMASILNVPADQFLQAYWRFRVAYDEAAFDPYDYWNRVAEQLSRNLSDPQIATLLEVDAHGWSHPSAVVPQWAREIHEAGLKTALLSNMPTTVRDHIVRCDWLPAFDQRTFSCDVRVAKPAEAIFRQCLNGLHVDPREILFLDDRPENVRAAETLGPHAIVYMTPNQAAQEIVRRFDMPVPLVATLDEDNEEDQQRAGATSYRQTDAARDCGNDHSCRVGSPRWVAFGGGNRRDAIFRRPASRSY